MIFQDSQRTFSEYLEKEWKISFTGELLIKPCTTDPPGPWVRVMFFLIAPEWNLSSEQQEYVGSPPLTNQPVPVLPNSSKFHHLRSRSNSVSLSGGSEEKLWLWEQCIWSTLHGPQHIPDPKMWIPSLYLHASNILGKMTSEEPRACSICAVEILL